MANDQSATKIVCAKCLEVKRGTRHHVYPQRFFGGIGPILWLCRQCHDALERQIPQHTQLHKADYLQLAQEFLAIS